MSLNKSEKYFKQNLRDLLENGYMDNDPRAKYKDGEDATSTFITQIVEKYDISKGELPITESRPIAWKTGINEMLAIYQSQTNTQEGFERHGCDWWQPWMNEEGNIGRAYSHNLESHRPNEMNRSVVKVKKKIIDREEASKPEEVKLIWEIETPVLKENCQSTWVGKIIDGKYGDFIVLEKLRRSHDEFVIQFLDTGFKKITSQRQLQNKNVKNPYARTVCDFGYYGDYKSVNGFSEEEVVQLQKKWVQMIERCSSKNEKLERWNLSMICTEWHSFEGFLRTIKKVPQYFIAKDANFKGFVLDKDYFGSSFYSPETSVFITLYDNEIYKYKAIKDELTGEIYLSQGEYARAYGLSSSAYVHEILSKKITNSKYKITYIENGNYVYRYELSRNQVNELLNELIKNKFSRRHLTSFFNWSNHNKKMLVECAYETLWSVSVVNDKTYIDLTLIQRSSDVCTANHINKIQYVALMMMVAKHCSYECGVFMHVVQNYHIYNTHFDNAHELLRRIEKLEQREKQSQPKLTLNVPDGTSFYDIKPSDFTLDGYYPITPQLKFQLAI